MPRPSRLTRRFSYHPDSFTTASRHAPSPLVVTCSWLTVSVSSGTMCRRRISYGSSPRSCAILSRCTSSAKRGCGVPCPRFGPHGGLFVNTRSPRKRYAGTSYVAVWRGDHADVRARHAQHFFQRAVHVVRRLRRRPERQFAVRPEIGDGRVLFHWQVRVAFIVEGILAHVLGLCKAAVHVAEFQRDLLVHVTV